MAEINPLPDLNMSSILRRILLPTVVLVLGGCELPELHPPAVAQPVIVGMTPDRGQQIIDSIFWYTGVQPDSVISHDGMLRLVLPGGALGHEIEMRSEGCFGRSPGMGAVHTLAAHAWASRDVSIHRDTIEVVFGESIVEVHSATRWGKASLLCSTGPATARIAVADLPGVGKP